MSIRSKITYTFTDEAPALATYSLLPIVKAFAASAGIDVETSDISLAGRILANFADRLEADQRIEDDLARLAVLATSPDANIIKLPNISASVPQLKGAIAELQGLGYKVPDFPEDPQTDEEKEVRARYAKILGSAVNPVLREGNSDRRAPAAVKAYARKHPHSMGKWSMASRSHADYMRGGDFFSSEQSITMAKAGDVRIEFVGKDGKVEVKKQLSLQEGEVLDSMFMSCGKLRDFFEKTLQDCKETGVMWSLHVKATMMKISHPIVFGHAVSVYYKDVFDKWGQLFEELGVNPNNGISSVYDKIKSLPASQQEEILHDIHEVYSHRPEMAMVDSVKGITNLHIPSDVIVDASMPAMIRNSGQMWGKDGKQKDTKAVMPESTYARIYQEMINFCKTNGAFDPTTMGSVPNVGLMAQKAEEYGSHDKTFEMTADGTMRVVLADGSEYPLAGELLFSDLAVDPGTDTIAMRALFRNPHRELLPGGYVQVRLQRAVNPQAITVPRDALIRTAQSAVVKVVNPQGVVEDVEVRADTLQGRDWIISRGLKGGERVIVENAAQHAAGSSVQAVVRQPASADAPSPLAASPAGQ